MTVMMILRQARKKKELVVGVMTSQHTIPALLII